MSRDLRTLGNRCINHDMLNLFNAKHSKKVPAVSLMYVCKPSSSTNSQHAVHLLKSVGECVS